MDGLKEFYNINNDQTLEFFNAHQAYDVEHSRKVAELIETYVSPERAERATIKARDAQWQFLDGMCRMADIHANVKFKVNTTPHAT